MKHRDLDSSVFVTLSRELFCFEYVLYSLSFTGLRDLVRQWPAVHNQNKQRFLNEFLKRQYFPSTLYLLYLPPSFAPLLVQ